LQKGIFPYEFRTSCHWDLVTVIFPLLFLCDDILDK